MDKIVFTDWNTVIIDDRLEISSNKFLNILEKNIKTHEYNVFYDNNTFLITYQGIDYEVILPPSSEKSLESKEYTPLVLKLLLLSFVEKRYNDEENLENVKKVKVSEMDDSFYEDINEEEDYILYLDFLKKRLSTVKTPEEKRVINTKIAKIAQKIEEMQMDTRKKLLNPLNLQNYMYRFIYDLLKKTELLDYNNRKVLAGKIRKILEEYKVELDKYIIKRKKQQLVIGNPLLSMSTLDKIIDIEFLIDEIKKKNNLQDKINIETKKIEDELNEIIDVNQKSAGGKK